MPHTPEPEIFKAILTLTDSIETTNKSPIPKYAHWVLRQMPYMRQAYATKEKFVREQVENSLNRFSADDETRCALDSMLGRERLLSEKENRSPMYHSRAMYDEVCHSPSPGFTTFLTGSTDLWLHHRRPRHNIHNHNMGTKNLRRVPRSTIKSPLHPHLLLPLGRNLKTTTNLRRNHQNAISVLRCHSRRNYQIFPHFNSDYAASICRHRSPREENPTRHRCNPNGPRPLLLHALLLYS